MLHASMIAGMAITHTGTSLPHGLSYAVTYEQGIPHGRAVGMFLGGYVEMYAGKEDALAVVQLLGFADTAAFRRYVTELLGVVEIPETLLQSSAAMVMADPGKLKNYPYPTTKEELEKMAN